MSLKTYTDEDGNEYDLVLKEIAAIVQGPMEGTTYIYLRRSRIMIDVPDAVGQKVRADLRDFHNAVQTA